MVHVLVIDDEQAFRESVAALLSFEGFRVSTASRGDEALRLVQSTPEDPVDVFLVDFRMPGLDGGQTLQALRARGIKQCAILLSAIGDITAIATRFGFDAAVQKPCQLDELLAAIRDCTSCRVHPASTEAVGSNALSP